jgi:hypothetical protein
MTGGDLRALGRPVPGAAARFAPWALLAAALYRTACLLPAVRFDDGTVWTGRHALWSALFPVFWIGDPRSLPAAGSNLALLAACVLALLGRARLSWLLAVVGGVLGGVALWLLRVGGPVLFDEAGASKAQFQTLLLGGVLWLLSFAAVGAGALVAQALGSRVMDRAPRTRMVTSLASASAACALAAATIAWHTRTVRGLPARVAGAARADDATALDAAFRLGGAPDDDDAALALLTTLGLAHAGRAVAVPIAWKVRFSDQRCDTPAGARALAALDEGATTTGAPGFVRLAGVCRRNGTRVQYPQVWAPIIAGALAHRQAALLAAVLAEGVDARCPVTPDGPPLEAMFTARLTAPQRDTVWAGARARDAANRGEPVDGCGFPPGVFTPPPLPHPAPVRPVTPAPFPALLRPMPIAPDTG